MVFRTSYHRLAAVLAVLGVAACATPRADWPLDRQASAERMRADVETLASDAFGGREAGTPGFQKAAAYVEAAFRQMGLTPGGTRGYRQPVPLRRAMADPQGAAMAIIKDGTPQPLGLMDDFAMLAGRIAEEVTVTAPMVFVGHGIDAPSLGYTAYQDHDVSGKIVALLPGVPPGLPSEERAHFSNPETKRATAARHGAVGIIGLSSVRGTTESGRAALARSVALADDIVAYKDGRKAVIDASALMTSAGTDKLLAAAGVDPDAVFAAKPALGPLGVTLSMTAKTSYTDYKSPNIIGMIEGSDPVLKDEYVVLTAHLDHIGRLTSVQRGVDVINNGAMDNATGTATLLEEARRFVGAEERPKRSILFLALTAEEKGLLGSEYFVHHPTVPREAMVANVNLDMPIALFDFVDVIAFGAQHSSLKETTATAAAKLDVALSPDPVPEQALFVRSDHYNFVKKGIPSVFLFFGFGNGGDDVFSDFMVTHYHRPSDEIGLPIRYDVAAKFAELNYLIASEIANAPDRPRWNEDSLFGTLFAPLAEEGAPSPGM